MSTTKYVTVHSESNGKILEHPEEYSVSTTFQSVGNQMIRFTCPETKDKGFFKNQRGLAAAKEFSGL